MMAIRPNAQVVARQARPREKIAELPGIGCATATRVPTKQALGRGTVRDGQRWLDIYRC